MRRELIAHELELSLQEFLQAPRLQVIEISGQRPASDERRESWIPIKYGPASDDDWFGVVPATVRFERSPRAASERLDLAIKARPRPNLDPLDRRASENCARPTIFEGQSGPAPDIVGGPSLTCPFPCRAWRGLQRPWPRR